MIFIIPGSGLVAALPDHFSVILSSRAESVQKMSSLETSLLTCWALTYGTAVQTTLVTNDGSILMAPGLAGNITIVIKFRRKVL
jgi:hypothetical protein